MTKTPEELFQEREKRMQDVAALRTPDRIPFVPVDSGFFCTYTGLTWEEAMYDSKKLVDALIKTNLDFEFDAYYPPHVFTPGTANDILDFKQLKWAGAKNSDNRTHPNTIYQFVLPGSLGRGTMPAEDYDWFLDDPTDYIIRRHWPKIASKLEPLRDLPPLHNIISYYVGMPQLLPALSSPSIVEALTALLEASKEIGKWGESMGPYFEAMTKAGFPPVGLAMSIAPYDYFGDFLRGTTHCMIDMYQRPEKLKQAIDRVTPWIINWSLEQARANSHVCKRVFIPIHSASGGFMSEEQHKEFFWPSFRKVLMALIEEGFTPVVETEGIYTDRFETIKDVPKGKVIYLIESDLFKAKEILGGTACIAGGPPATMMEIGSPEEVKAYCKKVIDTVGKDGGFIMSTEVPLITAKPENVKAAAEFTREYGVY